MLANPEQTFMMHHSLARQALQKLDSNSALTHLCEAESVYQKIQRERERSDFRKVDFSLYGSSPCESKTPNYHDMLIELREDCSHQAYIEGRDKLRREGWSENGINNIPSRQRGLNEIVRFWNSDPRPQEMPEFRLKDAVLIKKCGTETFVPGLVQSFVYDSGQRQWRYEVRVCNETLIATKTGMVLDTRAH